MVDFEFELKVWKRAGFHCELHHKIEGKVPCDECLERTREDMKFARNAERKAYKETCDEIMNVVEEDLKNHNAY